MSHENSMDIVDGWIASAEKIPSAHADDRYDPAISLLVIHNISLPPGEFGSNDVVDLFTGNLDVNRDPFFKEIASLRVSSHLFIRRNGHIMQFVPFTKRAWHAGASCFQGRSKCNDFSIGIELEGTDYTPYTESQYVVLSDVTRKLQQEYPAITLGRIVGHNDIAPGRKTDPGISFDWSKYRQKISTRENYDVN